MKAAATRCGCASKGAAPRACESCPHKGYLEALVRDTGSSTHVRWLESLARGSLKFDQLCARVGTEQRLYEALGVPFAPPELREHPTPTVPKLVAGVRGVFHVHTTWSDGTASIIDMARAAADAGFGYLGISEHSRAASYAHGLDPTRLRAQAVAMEEARREVPRVALLHGVEVDVLADGSLDLDDATLAELDFVVASVHTELDMPPREMTARLLRAVSHPLVTILGHPTGRLLPGRRGSAFDLDAVADAAAANDTFLEINREPAATRPGRRTDSARGSPRRAVCHRSRRPLAARFERHEPGRIGRATRRPHFIANPECKGATRGRCVSCGASKKSKAHTHPDVNPSLE